MNYCHARSDHLMINMTELPQRQDYTTKPKKKMTKKKSTPRRQVVMLLSEMNLILLKKTELWRIKMENVMRTCRPPPQYNFEREQSIF